MKYVKILATAVAAAALFACGGSDDSNPNEDAAKAISSLASKANDLATKTEWEAIQGLINKVEDKQEKAKLQAELDKNINKVKPLNIIKDGVLSESFKAFGALYEINDKVFVKCDAELTSCDKAKADQIFSRGVVSKKDGWLVLKDDSSTDILALSDKKYYGETSVEDSAKDFNESIRIGYGDVEDFIYVSDAEKIKAAEEAIKTFADNKEPAKDDWEETQTTINKVKTATEKAKLTAKLDKLVLKIKPLEVEKNGMKKESFKASGALYEINEDKFVKCEGELTTCVGAKDDDVYAKGTVSIKNDWLVLTYGGISDAYAKANDKYYGINGEEEFDKNFEVNIRIGSEPVDNFEYVKK